MKPTTLNLTTREVLGSEVVTVDSEIVETRLAGSVRAKKKKLIQDAIKQITT